MKALCDGAVAVGVYREGTVRKVLCSACLEPVDLLPGAVVDDKWTRGPAGTPIPKEWEAGLWGLNAGVEVAVRGGWSDADVLKEVGQLLESYRERTPHTE